VVAEWEHHFGAIDNTNKLKIMIEKVNIKHIDKKCDFLADLVHDYYIQQDSDAYTSVDVIYNSGSYSIFGQISSEYSASTIELKEHLSMMECLQEYSLQKSIDRFDINLSTFSSGSLYYLDNNYASKSCISVGYASSGVNGHQNGLPYDVVISNFLTNILASEPGPSKITADMLNGVLSLDVTAPTTSSFESCKEFLNVYSTFLTTGSINFNVDAFDDELDEHSNGMSGMKLQGDLYGSYCSVSSGPLAGRDLLQIDRLSTLAARKLAYTIFNNNNRSIDVKIEMCYKKGRRQPLYVKSIIDGIESYITDDYSPNSLLEYIGGKRELSIDFNTSHIDKML
jgi:S-adenosylmethionine synthetase